jgi:hypothetical protein
MRTLRGELLHVRRGDPAAGHAELPEADVVEEDQHDIGAAFDGRTICGKVAGSEAWQVRPTSPFKRQSGRGSENLPCAGGAGAVCC